MLNHDVFLLTLTNGPTPFGELVNQLGILSTARQ